MTKLNKPSNRLFCFSMFLRRSYKQHSFLLFFALFIGITTSLSLHAQEPYNWHKDRHNRIAIDFNKTHEEVKSYISRYIPHVTDSMMAMWEQSRALETYYLHGKKHYFHSAGPNLFRIDKTCRDIKAGFNKVGDNGAMADDINNIPAIMKNAGSDHMAEPKRMRVKYTITVMPDVVPEGTMLRCWLPFPRTDVKRQTNVKLLSTSQDNFVRSPMSCDHSSIYMERRAQKGQPTIFSEEFEFTSAGAWFNLKPADVKPYNKRSAAYRKHTENRRQHLIVTPRLQQLADSITQGISNPLLQARAIFSYINDHFPWASAREYSTIPNIPEYVVENRHGDCGQVTLLFLTLCRAKGIPGHFQSGFMMHPHERNLHDWCEIYFEGPGWVPVDQSFGEPDFATDEATRYFFLGGIDSWRMVVNNDFSQKLYPAKKFPRSETVDFQRGEVEWHGGNLYFDKWNWDIDVQYLEP